MVGRVVVVGAINTDLVITAPHLPAPGETVVGGGLQTFGGGKGANAAVAAARAGAKVVLIGAVGADESGEHALAQLRTDGVDTSAVAVFDDEPTGAALIVVDAQGENQIVIGPGANGAVSPSHIRAALAESLPAADVVLVSTEIPFDAVAAAIQSAAAAQVQCLLNPAPVIAGLADLLAHGPVLTPNAIELNELARSLGDASVPHEEEIEACLRRLGNRTQAPVIVTLGDAGCAVRLPDGEVNRIPTHEIADVIDTTGAGDTFNGVLAAHLATGATLNSAVSTAVVAASLSVTAAGARVGMPSASAITMATTTTNGKS